MNWLFQNKGTSKQISHMPETVITGTIQNVAYDFEHTTANLLSRDDNVHGNSESFIYDNLNRLTQINTNGNIFNTAYNNTGNIISKTDVGTYSYDTNKIHAVTQVTGNDYLPSQNQNITYTPFKKVNKIMEGDNELNFIYGLSEQRKKTILKENGNISKTKYFFGSYEKTIEADGTVKEYCFIPGGAVYKNLLSSVSIERSRNTGQSSVLSSQLLFTYTDHLGSITHITDNEGNLLAEQSFGAWGRMRNPETWQYPSERTILKTV